MISLLLIPLIYSFEQESIQVCCGDTETIVGCISEKELSHLGYLAVVKETEVVGSTPLGGGTDCDYLADRDKKCYYRDNLTGGCINGCLTNYDCNAIFRCEKEKIITEEKVTTILETTNYKMIIMGLVFVSLILIGVVTEEEIRKRIIKKRQPETEEEAKVIEQAEEKKEGVKEEEKIEK